MNERATVLVLEDDDILRELISETLSDEGYEVIDSATPERAIEMARLHRFQVFLTDVRMAGSSDGVGVLQTLKQRSPSMKSIIMTGYASQDVPIRAMKLQADDYLLKGDIGFGMVQLLSSVKRVLESTDKQSSTLQKALGFFRLPLKVLAEARVGALQASRDAFFSHLYLGMRPGHLSPDLAYLFWLAVEELERAFHRLESPSEVARLTQGYEELSALLLSSEKPPTRPSSDLSLAKFCNLYDRVRAGALTAASLKTAVLLRTDERLRMASLENYTLYRDFWGADSEEAPVFSQDPRIGSLIGPFRLVQRLEGVDDVVRYRAIGGIDKSAHLVEIISLPDASSIREQDVRDSVYHEIKGGQLYLVRPWSEAIRTLRSLVLPAGRRPLEVLTLLGPVMKIVHEAHLIELSDGSITPGRVILTGHGPRLPFFAMLGAQELRETTQPLHWQNLIYIDPALINGGPLVPGNDQYSLGVIALEMWTGLSGLSLSELLCQSHSEVWDSHSSSFDAAVRRMLGQGRGRYTDLILAYTALLDSVQSSK